jgi:hypothetical protein
LEELLFRQLHLRNLSSLTLNRLLLEKLELSFIFYD